MCRNGGRQASLISMPSGSPHQSRAGFRRQCEGSAGHGASRFAGYDIQRLRTSSSQSHGRGSGADRHTTFGPRSCTQRVPPGGSCRTRKRNRRGIRQLRFTDHGGAEGDRTPDLLNAIQALSQLSYGPMRQKKLCPLPKMVNKIEVFRS